MILSSNPLETFDKIYWKIFLIVIFSLRKYIYIYLLLFGHTSLLSVNYIIFHYQTILFWLRNVIWVFPFRQHWIKGFRPSALIFREWNKNCFLFIFIISNRIQFKWKIIKGMKWGSFFTKINIMSYHDMKKKQIAYFFVTH